MNRVQDIGVYTPAGAMGITGRVLMSDGRTRVELCVEALCQDGCRTVNEYICLLKTGEVFQEVAMLSRTERQAVLDELESIMSVYTGPCDS